MGVKQLFVILTLFLAACSQNEVIVMDELQISSSAFEHNEMIPSKYTCDGENVNPPINIEGIPKETVSLVLICDDPDAPMGIWVHWVVWNIKPTNKIEEDSVPGTEGMNDFKKNSYGGPCPPSGTHRYYFKVYALDIKLDIKESSTKEDVENAMVDHILSAGELIGLYKRT
ncbi:MAG: YbhB/YbcL family Raf kinase inhibitor-like protein [archaeon]